MTWLTHESAHVSAPLKTIDNARPDLATEIEHTIDLPILCLRSQNPAAGSTLSIAYTPSARMLELFALDAYIKAYIGHTLVRDMEYFVQTIADECARVVEVQVECVGRIRYNGLNMGQNIRVRASV